MLELRNISKQYGTNEDAVLALKSVNITFASSGFVTILGPSGCGKTTMLNIIGGLDQYTDGDLIIEGKSTKTFKSRDWDSYRNYRIGFVFQSYNLISHLTVVENVELSLVLNGTSANKRRAMALKALENVGLSDQAKKRPNQLSGGQMQRVAIARALVNDPDIILADEPTGALDSETSVQVMDILHEISKEKLIIMVTHNEVLAEQYSDRIVRLKDGEVIGDSENVKTKVDSGIPLEKESSSKTSMGIMTSLKMSFRNLVAKKGRTILSSVAGAIGILGVALVLALSNGFQGYVANVEAKSVNAIPVTISTIGQTTEEIINSVVSGPQLDEYPDSDEVLVYNPSSSTTQNIHYNRFTDEYIKYVENAVNLGYAQSVLVNYGNMQMNLLSTYKDNNGKDRYTVVQETQSNGLSLTSELGLPNTIYHELYGQKDFIEGSYDVIEGHYPTQPEEIVLIVDKYNRVSQYIYNALGLGDISLPTGEYKNVNFKDIVNRDFKIVYHDAFYTEVLPGDPMYDTYTEDIVDSTGNVSTRTRRFYAPGWQEEDKLAELFHSDDEDIGLNLKISGIVRVKDDALMNLMNPSIGYTKELKEIFLTKSLEKVTSDESSMVSTINDHTIEGSNIKFSVPSSKWDFDLTLQGNDLVGTYTNERGNSHDITFKRESGSGLGGSFSWSTKTLTFNSNGSLTYRKGDPYNSINTAALSNAALVNAEALIAAIEFSTTGVNPDPTKWAFKDDEGNPNPEKPYTSVEDFFAVALKLVNPIIRRDYTKSAIDANDYGRLDPDDASSRYLSSTAYLRVTRMLGADLTNQFETLWNTNATLFVLASVLGASLTTSIAIFPKDLKTKNKLFEYLDNWNDTHMENERIYYMDIVGTVTEGVGTMIQIITIVLIVFSSLALLVSSVMTAILTYVSVVERKKEIGVLRALGARKFDVGMLFETETVLIGLFSGVIGVVLTYLFSIPINLILNAAFPGQGLSSIASLPWWYALILILISGLLTFFAGFFPSQIASKKDPVESLRSE